MTGPVFALPETLTALPVLVFVAETSVVTLSTMRTIFVMRGMKSLAPVLGFFEISIWLFAVGQIMQNLRDPLCYLAFAGGFTTGNLLGILIEGKLGLGTLVVRLITTRDTQGLINSLRQADYGVTALDARGSRGPVQVVLTVVPRKELRQVLALVERFDARAFYSVDDIHSATGGIFPVAGMAARRAVPAAAT